MLRIAIALGALAFAEAGATQPSVGAAGPALPAWLAGCWIEETGAVWTEECWTSARGGMMIGSGRTGEGDRVKFWESMQIIRDGADLSFWAAPLGQNRTRFRARASGGPGASFHNDAHDYPQRVRYWREGELLLAEAARADGSKAQRWRFRRM